MRTALNIVGTVAIGLGLIWIAQRGGWMPWPRASFTLPGTTWLWYGAVPVLGGFTLIVLGRRL